MNPSTLSKFLTASLTLGWLLGLTGCAMNRPGARAGFSEPSGFLGDYSQMHGGLPDRANLFYVNHSANWAKYKKLYLQPVELWTAATNSRLNNITRRNQQLLADYYYNSISNALRINYFMVDHAGPDILVVRAALTDPQPASPVVDFVAGNHSRPQLACFGRQTLSGTGIEAGSFVMELEIVDGESQERLLAELDTHSGTTDLRYNFHRTWGDIQRSMDRWADRLATCLWEEKTGARNKSDL